MLGLAPITRAQRSVLIATVIAAWALTHRYSGVRHDGILYAAQALHRLHPENFVGDLFFAYGSQDSYSLFGPLYAGLVAWFGLPMASLALMLASQMAWLLASALLAGCLLRGQAYWYALVLIATLHRGYGSDNVFSYAETFVTARVVAEPFLLSSLAAFLGERRRIGYALLIAGTLLHPAIAFPVIVTVVAMNTSPKIVAGLSFLGGITVAILVAGTIPAPPPLQIMDPEWYKISLDRSPFIFINHWKAHEFAEPLFAAAILFLAGVMSAGILRRFWWAILFAGIVGFALSAISALWPIALLIQMQPWRAAWLLKVSGAFAAIYSGRILLSQGAAGQSLLAIFAACWLGAEEGGAFVAALIAVLYPSFTKSVQVGRTIAKSRNLILGGVLLASTAPLLLAAEDVLRVLSDLATGLYYDFPQWSVLAIEWTALMPFLAAAAIAVLVLSFWHLQLGRKAALGLTVGMIFLGITSWVKIIQVNPQIISTAPLLTAEAKALIPKGSLTYFEGGHVYLWFALERPSYASHQQTAGIVFSRNAAIEARRRLELVAPLGLDAHMDWKPAIWPFKSNEPIPARAVVNTCQDPILDYIVLRRPVTGEPALHPDALLALQIRPDREPISYQVYDCRKLRASLNG